MYFILVFSALMTQQNMSLLVSLGYYIILSEASVSIFAIYNFKCGLESGMWSIQ